MDIEDKHFNDLITNKEKEVETEIADHSTSDKFEDDIKKAELNINKKSEKSAELELIKKINSGNVQNPEVFVTECYHGITNGSPCALCDLDNQVTISDKEEVEEEDIFEDGNGAIIKSLSSTEEQLRDLLVQKGNLKNEFGAQKTFQDDLLKKFNGIAGSNNQRASHLMNGLIENIQRGYSDGLSFRKELIKITTEIIKVLEKMNKGGEEGISYDDIKKIANEVIKRKKD